MKDNNQSMNVRYQAKAKQEVKKPYDPPTAVFVPTEVEGRMLAKCKPGGAFCLKSPFAQFAADLHSSICTSKKDSSTDRMWANW